MHALVLSSLAEQDRIVSALALLEGMVDAEPLMLDREPGIAATLCDIFVKTGMGDTQSIELMFSLFICFHCLNFICFLSAKDLNVSQMRYSSSAHLIAIATQKQQIVRVTNEFNYIYS